MKTTEIINQLKKENQDFEWYPTDINILRHIANDLKGRFLSHRREISMLDIGAGDGNVFRVLSDHFQIDNFKKYAIEKSSILSGQLPDDVFIIGTDFDQQTLIDKEINCIFCNPPYSVFVEWVVKIIKEAFCEIIYLVIPKRWKDNEAIQEAIRLREADIKVLDSFNFMNSQYRQARTEVDIIAVNLSDSSYTWSDSLHMKTDPFSLWFDEHFKINVNFHDDREDETITEKRKKFYDKALVPGQNLIDCLVELYLSDMQHLINNYKALEKLDCDLLKELGVSLLKLREGLQTKIKGLKKLYWHEIFDNLESLTSRLTKSSRDKLLKTLINNTSVDFTPENIYAVVLWAIRNSNKYFDNQLVTVYKELSRPANVQNYKSNHVFIDDEWRYYEGVRDGKITHYKLDYRLVMDRRCSIESSYHGEKKLTESAINFINDLVVIASNLGFDGCQTLPPYHSNSNSGYIPGQKYEFTCNAGVLFSCRFFLNGNIHITPNKEFIKKLNIEAARLLGWIKSPKDAFSEMDMSMADATHYYNSNIKIIPEHLPLLLNVQDHNQNN